MEETIVDDINLGAIFSAQGYDNVESKKEKRIQLYENEDIILEQRGNKYYLSLYDKDGKFRREVVITVKDDYKVSLFNDK